MATQLTLQEYHRKQAEQAWLRRSGYERRRKVAECVAAIMAMPERRSGDERRED